MLSLVSLTAAVPPTATALRAAGVPITDADEQKVVALAEHVLQVYSACEQKIHQVLCVIGSVCEHYDYDSRVLLLLGKSMQAVGVTLQLVSPEAALVNKLGASASLPTASAQCSSCWSTSRAPTSLKASAAWAGLRPRTAFRACSRRRAAGL